MLLNVLLPPDMIQFLQSQMNYIIHKVICMAQTNNLLLTIQMPVPSV